MKKFKLHIYSKIFIIDVLLIFAMSYLIPLLSGYPPYSEEASFQIQIEGLTHIQQYMAFGVFGIILHFTFLTICFKNIFKFLKGYENNEKFSNTFIKKIREQCFSINKKIILFQLFVLILLLTLLFINVKISIVLCIKFLLIYTSFMMSSAIIYIILIRDDINTIIRKTYTFYGELPLKIKKTKFHMNLITNLLPFFFIVIVISCLLGYTKVCDQLGESSYYYYSLYLSDINYSQVTYDELKDALGKIPLKNREDYFLIINKNNQDSIYFSSPNGYVSDFFLLYMENYSSQTNGRIYEYFGVEEQAYVKTVHLASGEDLIIGFKYSNTSVDTIIFFVTIAVLSTILISVVLVVWARNTSKNITEVSTAMTEIATNENVDKIKTLPILSTNEIGDLTSAFNKIQKLTYNHIKQIQDNKDTLMEKERLASLGQLIGGIAHNLKTPIMSISGATEGLNDLIKEYDSSIDDPEVTSQDHHDIAKDMSSWTEKIKTHTEYMSDIITAVKGQAVTLSETDSVHFTLDELVKRVDILMKHELKNALIYLNISMKADEHTTINGDINSLVQVINNMISNAIQAYDGKTNKNIDLVLEEKDNTIYIHVKDYASGMPKSVQNKLFKEMITTKGKNGTGLGLYMSYSTIKAHFNGDITFESEEGKGTTFTIILPL